MIKNMSKKELIEYLYENIICDLSFCTSANEIVETIDMNFQNLISYLEKEEDAAKNDVKKSMDTQYIAEILKAQCLGVMQALMFSKAEMAEITRSLANDFSK